MSRREDVWSKTWEVNPTAGNRFNNFELPYNYDSASDILDQLLTKQQSRLQGKTSSDIAKAKRGTAARLFSQGITGGSQFNDYVENAGSDILDNSYDAFAQLGINRMNQSIPLMQMDNANKLNVTNLAQNVDFQNIVNAINKMKMLQGQVNDWEQMDLQRDAQPGTLDDIFSGLGIAAQIASIPMTGGASGVSLLGSLMGKRGG